VWADAHTFSSERLRYRAPLPDDAPALVATFDEEVRRWQGWRDSTYRGRVAVQAQTRLFERASLDHCAATILVCTPDGTVIGDYVIQAAGSTTEVALGWSLGPAGRGQGFGTESLPVILDYVHRHVGVPRVRMGTDVANERALRQIAAAGAVVDGEADRELENGSVIRSRWFVHDDPVVRDHVERGPWIPPCRSQGP